MEPLDLMKITTRFRSFILLTGLLLPLSNLLQAQTSLALSSATVPPGGAPALNLSLSSPSSPLSAGILAPTASSPPTVFRRGSRGGTTGLSPSPTTLTFPAPLEIPAGSSSGTFLASAIAFTADQTATVTATLNGSSAAATL